MTLIDAGPLIALIDKGQGEVHQRCMQVQEVSHWTATHLLALFHRSNVLLGGLGGWPGQKALWDLLNKELSQFMPQHHRKQSECKR